MVARWLRLVTVSACGVLAASCVSETVCRGSADPTDCRMRGGPTEAAWSAVAAGAAWAVVGCRANGCAPPYRCNEASGFCERIPCRETTIDPCPAGYRCDPEDEVCR